MLLYLVAYGAALVVLGVVDVIYLATIAGKMFKETLGDVMLPEFRTVPAVLFYFLYPVGIVIFAVLPAVGTGRWTTALIYGALFGFFAYMTYEMTNLATIRNWTVSLAVTDVAWGTFVTAISAVAGFYATRWVSPA